MKNFKFLSLLFVCLAMAFAPAPVQAQDDDQGISFVNSLYTSSLTDTATNTGTAYLTLNTSRLRASGFSVAVVITELSGTTAGAVQLQGSIDGTNYARIDGNGVTALDSAYLYTATDQTGSQTVVWDFDHPIPFPYLRVRHTGIGTMASTLAAKLWVYRKRD
jgi:hypothetical protein